MWDALDRRRARPFDIKPAGMLALDVARIEAGLLLIDVDFFSSRKALIDAQKYSPYELGLGRLVSLDKGRVHRPQALRARARARARAGRSSASRSTGPTSNSSTSACGLAPAVGATASRVAVPVYSGGRQVGKATSTTWSPMLKQLIALATIDRPHFADGHDARDRDDGRSGAPPRRRHGRADAVLQSAAEDGDSAGIGDLWQPSG